MPVYEVEVEVDSGATRLPGTLTLPAGSMCVAVFAHGSGSSRFSSRNQAVARSLNELGCATLLFDLLSDDDDRRRVFDIPLLGGRVVDAVHWLSTRADTADLPTACFGASTGAAAALVAAAAVPDRVRAVVSRGGRPDLAADALPRVAAPTLLLVGSLDVEVLALNRAAAERLTCPWRLSIIEGASHLFEEPGTLEQVATEAGAWITSHTQSSPTPDGATGS